MFQMLTEMVGTKEFLRLVAFTKLVYTVEVGTPCFPVWGWLIGKLCATVTACIERCERGGGGRGLRLRRAVVGGRYIIRRVERAIKAVVEDGTGPGMFPQMKRILMTLGFVFVLEAIGAVHA